MGCRSCGVVAHAHGRVEVRLVDAPAMGRPVQVRWRKRRWLCPEPTCRVGSFVEQDEQIAAPRARLTSRACWWAIEQIRREHASVNGIRRQLGTGWRTVWEAILPLLEAADQDASRFDGVTILGVDWGSPACGGARVAPRVDQAGRGRRPGPEGADRDGRPHPRC
ncbi:MAG: transposase family protein [Actinomycetota bacterium]|nr:transposase family protein [Actinomycetota bacterium]